MARELKGDGESKAIRDYLASERYSSTIKQSIRADTEETKLAIRKQMMVVIDGLDEIMGFENERVVFNFGEKIYGYDKALVINVPFKTEYENGVLIRYLFVSPVGFGYLNFNFENIKADEIPGELYSKFLESRVETDTSLQHSTMAMSNTIGDLTILNYYFEKCAPQNLITDEFITNTYVSADGSGQILVGGRSGSPVVLTIEPGSPTDDPLEDIQTILGKFMEKRQQETDAANLELEQAQSRLEMASGVVSILSPGLDEEHSKNSKRWGLFGKSKSKNK